MNEQAQQKCSKEQNFRTQFCYIQVEFAVHSLFEKLRHHAYTHTEGTHSNLYILCMHIACVLVVVSLACYNMPVVRSALASKRNRSSRVRAFSLTNKVDIYIYIQFGAFTPIYSLLWKLLLLLLSFHCALAHSAFALSRCVVLSFFQFIASSLSSIVLILSCVSNCVQYVKVTYSYMRARTPKHIRSTRLNEIGLLILGGLHFQCSSLCTQRPTHVWNSMYTISNAARKTTATDNDNGTNVYLSDFGNTLSKRFAKNWMERNQKTFRMWKRERRTQSMFAAQNPHIQPL